MHGFLVRDVVVDANILGLGVSQQFGALPVAAGATQFQGQLRRLQGQAEQGRQQDEATAHRQSPANQGWQSTCAGP
ncbi:hypothetical protein D3C76_1612310 [compost metagenome]